MLTEDVSIAILGIILSAIAILGNLLVIFIITRHKSMQTAMNYLLANLAVMDAMTGLFTIPNVIMERTFSGDRTLLAVIVNSTSKSTGDILCKVKGTVWTSSAGSPAFLVFIAFERYMAVIHPFSRRGGITKRRLYWITPCCYILSLLNATPFFIMVEYQPDLEKCYESPSSAIDARYYSLVCFSLLFIIPSIVMLFLYTSVIRTIKKRQRLHSRDISCFTTARIKANRDVLRVVFVITILFIVCWGFIYNIYFIGHFFDDITLWNSFYECSILAACLNSAANPVLYCYFIKGFRDNFLDFFRCWCCETKPSSVSVNLNDNAASCDANTVTLVNIRPQCQT
ncbi:pyroglutamylated RF-amide peptide receptor [Nematostella vectensis]|uniref:pyroglutamylated RF-amide peptide receptor n=1 Tax=Nematostella vectensis TaxID=45351 RepID=UPI0020772D0D|nr:pyroglutamylated RF-amide peptide receptor [Nematostella vectensis]